MPGGATYTTQQVEARFRVVDAHTAGANAAFAGGDPALNAGATIDVGTPFRVRFTIAETGGGMQNNQDFKLRYSHDTGGGPGAFTDVPTSGGPVIMRPHDTYAHNTATSQLISSSAIVAGSCPTTANLTAQVSLTSTRTEFDFLLELGSGLTEGDTLDFRVVLADGTPVNTYTVTPRVTVGSTVALHELAGTVALQTTASGNLTHDLLVDSAEVVDDFNRANEGPPPSSEWSNTGFTSGLQVDNNQVRPSSTGNVGSRYEEEVAGDYMVLRVALPVIVSSIFSAATIYLTTNGRGAGTNGYSLEYIHNGTHFERKIIRWDNGTPTDLSVVGPAAFAAGNTIALVLTPTSVVPWRHNGTSWVKGTGVADTNHRSGLRAGLTFNISTSWRGDDFAFAPRATGGETHELAGQADLTTTAAGDLTVVTPQVVHELAGEAALTTSAAGALSLVHTLAGQSDLTTTAAGDLAVVTPAVELAGTIALTTSAEADLGMILALAGQSDLTTTVAGNLEIAGVVELAGTIALSTTAQGALSAVVGLAGQADLLTTVEGALSADLGLAGTVALVTTASGDLTLVGPPQTHELAGAIVLTTTAAGDLTLVPVIGPTTVTLRPYQGFPTGTLVEVYAAFYWKPPHPSRFMEWYGAALRREVDKGVKPTSTVIDSAVMTSQGVSFELQRGRYDFWGKVDNKWRKISASVP